MVNAVLKIKYLLLSFFIFLPQIAVCDAGPKENKNPNLIIIVIDTLGAKHLGAYTEGIKHSPNIDSLAKNGVIFKKAYSAAPWTKPSIASIFTGHYPSNHKLKGLNEVLSPDTYTIAEYFKDRGYKTSGIISHDLITKRHGFSQGFDNYTKVKFKGNVHKSITSNQVTDLGINWLKNNSKKSKFFLFLHYFDPHFDYQHHPEFDKTSWYKGKLKGGMGFRELRDLIPTFTDDDRRYLIDLYHEEIAFTDYHIGRLLNYLKESEIDKNTIIVLTADHGEEFLEHGGLGHTRTLYDELVNVPLIIHYPKLKAHSVPDGVSSMDLFPTLQELIFNEKASGLDGVSLVKYLDGTQANRLERVLMSEVDFESKNIKANLLGAFQLPFKLSIDKNNEKWEFYNIEKDQEKNNIYSSENSKVKELGKIIEEFRSNSNKNTKVEGKSLDNSPEDIEKLESLGYM